MIVNGSQESIPPVYVAWRPVRQIPVGLLYRTAAGWESIPGLLKRFTNTGSGYSTEAGGIDSLEPIPGLKSLQAQYKRMTMPVAILSE